MKLIIYMLIAEMLWSLGNYIDKYLLTKYLKGSGIGSLLIFSSLIALLVLPILYLIDPLIAVPSNMDKLLLMSTGIIYATIWLLPYFKALFIEDTSLVIALFQTVPVFSYILAYLLLGESLTNGQIWGGLVIIVGAIALVVDVKNFRLNYQVLGLMLLSSFGVALASTLFKFVASKGLSFTVSLFWEYCGIVLAALFYLVFIKSYREQFLRLLKLNSSRTLLINSFNEILNIIAKTLVYLTAASMPVALTWLVSSVQPLLTLVLGFILTTLFPWFAKESIEGSAVLQKLLGIVIMGVGTIILVVN